MVNTQINTLQYSAVHFDKICWLAVTFSIFYKKVISWSTSIYEIAYRSETIGLAWSVRSHHQTCTQPAKYKTSQTNYHNGVG